jgi:hypothetical protein
MGLKAIALLVLLVSGMAEAETLRFPKDKPQFSVRFDDSWTAVIRDSGIISAQPPGRGYAISIFPVDEATTGRGAIDVTLEQVEARFTDIGLAGTVESTNGNGVKLLRRDLSAKDKESPRELTIVAFTLDGKSYFALFQAASPAAEVQYAPDLKAVVESIAALKN